jgi:hypothetical protein
MRRTVTSAEQSALAALTPVERVMVAHACEDYAGQWYNNPLIRGDANSTARYVTEGHLPEVEARHGLGLVWRAVAEHLAANSHILAAGALSEDQRATRRDARRTEAAELMNRAGAACTAGRFVESAELVDRAELVLPGFKPFDRYRARVAAAAAGRG